MQNKKLKNYNRSKTEILRLLWDIVVFRLVAYLLNVICIIYYNFYTMMYIYEFSLNLTQFYINFSRQEHQIDMSYIGIVHFLRFSGISLYPLSFLLYSTSEENIDLS